ncbi:hypothetical protein EV652_13110 [Kribbella steppae]|uniref:Uncharacterized protein n=1 Tax=Kribbella steppae TaxID=2512223 RepID=A0A4V2RX66_9ACTN|nr:hypothetical protein EV652_13110 [Kribbella steppae]
MQCDCQEEDGQFQGSNVVTLRRNREQVTWAELALGIARAEHNTTSQAEH